MCEARNDPLKLGRVKVRIFGLHTDNLEVLSADDLPWASILIPTTEAGPAGHGTSVGGIPTGTWVFGVFLDGVARQQPLILGSIQGKAFRGETSKDAFGKKKQNSSTDFQKETDLGVDLTKGFFDTQEDALAGNPDPEYSKENESELNRLARGEKIEKTVEEYKKQDSMKGVKLALDRSEENKSKDKTSWDEPHTKRETKYSYNKVEVSEGGTIQEIDDTPSVERLQTIFSPGQSYLEWGTSGYEYKKIMGDSFQIKFSPQEKTFVHGRVDKNIDGEITELLAKSRTTEIYDTETKTVYDSSKNRVMGQINTLAGGDYVLMVNHNLNISANNKMEMDVGSTYKESFHDVHHAVYWQRQYSWNEGQVHSIRKRNVYEKNNESVYSIVIDNRRDLVANGDQDTTIAQNFKLWVGADQKKESSDYSLTVDGTAHEKVKKEVHRLFLDNHVDLIKKSRDTSVGENWKRAILGNDEEKIKGNARSLVKGNRDIGVEGTQQSQIGGSRKTEVLGNDEEQVKQTKNLQVGSWFYKKLANAFNRVGVWWIKTNTLNIIGTLHQEYIQRKDQLLSSLAIHVLNSLSLKVVGKYNIEVGGNFAVHVKGQFLIKADQGVIISSGTSITMGSGGNTTIGSSGALTIIAPNAIVTKDDIVPVTRKAAFPPPTVTSDIIDLSSLKSLSPPTIPNLSLTINKELDVRQPIEPTKPELPKPPEKGEFLNGRTSWAKDSKLSKTNDKSSFDE